MNLNGYVIEQCLKDEFKEFYKLLFTDLLRIREFQK